MRAAAGAREGSQDTDSDERLSMSVTVKFFKGHSFLKIHLHQQYFRPRRESKKGSLSSSVLKHLFYNLALCDVTEGGDS